MRRARRDGARRPIHYRKVDELPFDFVRRRLSVVVAGIHGEHLLVCKGAVEEMLLISTQAIENGDAAVLDGTKRSEIMSRTRALNEDGFRVIVVATREFAPGEIRPTYCTDDEASLVPRAATSPSSTRRRKRRRPRWRRCGRTASRSRSSPATTLS